MKILLDENLDESLTEFLLDHDVLHVNKMGWQGTRNGALFAKVEQYGFQALVTADKNMRFQQQMSRRPFFLIVLDIHPNVLENQVACIPLMKPELRKLKPGSISVIEGPHPKRRPT